MKRLNNEKSLAPYVVQFVPLKVDTATPEYAALQRKHRSEGNTIPKIFLIRADGTKLYAKSGALPGEQLPTLMTAAIREMGRPLSLGEVKILEGINSQIKEAIAGDELKKAAMMFAKLKKLGPFGQIGSYAKSALENNQLAGQYKEKVNGLIDQYSSALDSNEKLVSAIKAMMLKSDVGSLTPFKVALNELEKKVRSSLESPQLFSEVKNISSAVRRLNQSTGKSQQRAIETINRFATKKEAEPAKEYLMDLIAKSGVSTDSTTKQPTETGDLRTWTSNDGKFSIKASFVGLAGTSVKLKRESGKEISVPLSRLSASDQAFVRRQK